MTNSNGTDDGAPRIDEVLTSIRLPLENVEFTIEQFLLDNGARLDTETRMLLAGVRDCVGRVAVSTRRLEGPRPQSMAGKRSEVHAKVA